MQAFAVITAVATFLLLIAGGLVTSTDAGLSVPDWPLSYGQFFPPMVGGIRYEHTHRVIAAVVGLLIAVLAGWLRFRESRRWMRGLGYAALAAVIAQAVLGGLTVLWVLPAPVSVAHACLGQLVFCLVVSIALALSARWQTRAAGAAVDDAALRRVSLLATTALGVQLLLGAVIRHSGRGLMLHLAWAGLLVVLMGRLVWRVRRRHAHDRLLRRLAAALLVGVGGQILLGMLTLAWGQPVVVTTAHVALGALILAGSCALTLWAWRAVPSRDVERLRRRLADYLALTKPRLTALAVVTAGVGFLMGSSGPLQLPRLGALVLGAALVGGGANALNQWMEREADARMRRTRNRPLPAGRLAPRQGLWFGVGLSAAGLLGLGLWTNAVTLGIAALILATYLGGYTPLKRRSSLCTLVGAIPGALPPVMGWAAVRGGVSLEAGVLFALLFVWQLPHFLALAWVHRDDYAQAGFRMLPVLDPEGSSTARQILLYGLALLPISLLPTLLGAAGSRYFVGAAILGVWFAWVAASAARARSGRAANRLFLASVGYLPALLILMVVDKTPI